MARESRGSRVRLMRFLTAQRRTMTLAFAAQRTVEASRKDGFSPLDREWKS